MNRIRSSKYELLRIVAMIFIILDHVPCPADSLDINRSIWNVFFLGGKFGSNIFVIISVMLLIDKEFDFGRIVKVACSVIFYSILSICVGGGKEHYQIL